MHFNKPAHTGRGFGCEKRITLVFLTVPYIGPSKNKTPVFLRTSWTDGNIQIHVRGEGAWMDRVSCPGNQQQAQEHSRSLLTLCSSAIVDHTFLAWKGLIKINKQYKHCRNSDAGIYVTVASPTGGRDQLTAAWHLHTLRHTACAISGISKSPPCFKHFSHDANPSCIHEPGLPRGMQIRADVQGGWGC